MLKARIAVFVSGGGTNLQALIDADRALETLQANGEDAYILGEVVKSEEGVILW